MQLQVETDPTNLEALKEEITRLWVPKMVDSEVCAMWLKVCRAGCRRLSREVGTLTTSCLYVSI